jgi:hypothetical protein
MKQPTLRPFARRYACPPERRRRSGQRDSTKIKGCGPLTENRSRRSFEFRINPVYAGTPPLSVCNQTRPDELSAKETRKPEGFDLFCAPAVSDRTRPVRTEAKLRSSGLSTAA